MGLKVVRVIIPVTSPTPMVVAFAPMVRVFIAEPSHISRLPFIDEGFSLCRFNTPFTVKLPVDVIPPVPLMVKLFTTPVNIEEGSVIAEVLVNNNVALALLASMVPLVRDGELPEIVSVFAPRLNVPLVNVRVPPTVTAPPKPTPVARSKVRLFSETEGRVVLAPLPPKLMLLELPPINVPDVFVMVPLMVKVFAPILKAPFISFSDDARVRLPLRTNPWVLLILKVSIVLLTNEPEGMF